MTNRLKLSDLKAGDQIRADGGFKCIRENAILTVQKDDGEHDGELYITCNDGKHFLDGQLRRDGTLTGFQRVTDEAKPPNAITLAMVQAWHLQNCAHYTGKDCFGYIYQCIEYPRLKRNDRYDKKTRSVNSEWMVDGAPVLDLDAAIAALNIPPVINPEEQALLDQLSEDWMPRNEQKARGLDFLKLYRLSELGLIEWREGCCRRRPANPESKPPHTDAAS